LKSPTIIEASKFVEAGGILHSFGTTSTEKNAFPGIPEKFRLS
jgi:hypothetical protein